VYAWLQEHTTHMICCSPIQADLMARGEGRPEGTGQRQADFLIPPAIDLGRFEEAASRVNGDRRGAVCVASWRNVGKGQRNIMEWAAENGGVDIYGGGFLAPQGSREIPYAQMPDLLAHYERFVFLPTVLEPFGRVVAEAWAAGCEVVTNRLVGAGYWLENEPEAIERAGERFWNVVLDA
jgi:glycosyltransferase involved in cell wall biosynthesis